MPGNDNFYSDDRAECPDDVRTVELEMLPKKYSSAQQFHPQKYKSHFPIQQSF